MNETLETNRAYQFAQLESALRSERSDRVQAALEKLRRLGVEVRLSPELQFLPNRIEPERQGAEDRQEAAS